MVLISGFTNAFKDILGCEEVKKQLANCQTELSSCQSNLKQSLGREENLKNQLATCQSTLNSLNQTLSACQNNLIQCKKDLNYSLQEIDRLSGCCNRLENCNVELEKCKQEKIITKDNIDFYNVLIESSEIKLITFITILIVPVSVSLIDVIIKIKSPEWLRKLILLAKVLSAFISIAFIVSFWLEIPLKITIIMAAFASAITLVFGKKEEV